MVKITRGESPSVEIFILSEDQYQHMAIFPHSVKVGVGGTRAGGDDDA